MPLSPTARRLLAARIVRDAGPDGIAKEDLIRELAEIEGLNPIAAIVVINDAVDHRLFRLTRRRQCIAPRQEQAA